MKEQIKQAVKELKPLLDDVTTSDLQGLCDVRAWKIIHERTPETKFDSCFWERMDISDQILGGIYREHGGII